MRSKSSKSKYIAMIIVSVLGIYFSTYFFKSTSNHHHGASKAQKVTVDVSNMDEIEREVYAEYQKLLAAINTTYRSHVKPIFKKKCFDCHTTDQTSYPWYYSLPIAKQLIDRDIKEALSHLDMTDDFPFHGHGSPKEDLDELEEVVHDGSMPPFQYLLLHRGGELDTEEVNIILDWSEKTRALLQEMN